MSPKHEINFHTLIEIEPGYWKFSVLLVSHRISARVVIDLISANLGDCQYSLLLLLLPSSFIYLTLAEVKIFTIKIFT